MTMVADRYTYRVGWSAEDEEFVGTCAEFPSLSWLDADEDETFRGIRKLVRETVVEMAAAGEPVPEPISLRRYSGKFQVRTTPEIHRRLVIEATEAQVSLNRLINSKLLG
ncbi:MAG: type II toxin-antitoxin system HicB family antitoxin [Elstera sp.]|jgi:predicted HicB family RNase H-like nuclease|uniref:type II toxin-antitoxin system HicB family antitoxin n=1 Tax=Elstera sp. TaxID=1916664 RepID=UPI0037C060A9